MGIITSAAKLVIQFNEATLPAQPGTWACSAHQHRFIQFIFSPIIGSASDHFDRPESRPTSASALFMLMAESPPAWAGCSLGDNLQHPRTAIHGLYIADVTPAATPRNSACWALPRAGVHRRPAWRHSWGHRRDALLGGRGPESRQCAVWLFHPPGRRRRARHPSACAAMWCIRYACCAASELLGGGRLPRRHGAKRCPTFRAVCGPAMRLERNEYSLRW